MEMALDGYLFTQRFGVTREEYQDLFTVPDEYSLALVARYHSSPENVPRNQQDLQKVVR